MKLFMFEIHSWVNGEPRINHSSNTKSVWNENLVCINMRVSRRNVIERKKTLEGNSDFNSIFFLSSKKYCPDFTPLYIIQSVSNIFSIQRTRRRKMRDWLLQRVTDSFLLIIICRYMYGWEHELYTQGLSGNSWGNHHVLNPGFLLKYYPHKKQSSTPI